MLIKVGKSTWLRTGLINELTVIFNEHLDMKPYSVYVCTENESFEWSEHDTEEEAIKALNDLAEEINNANQPQGAAAGLPNGSRCQLRIGLMNIRSEAVQLMSRIPTPPLFYKGVIQMIDDDDYYPCDNCDNLLKTLAECRI